MKPLNNLLRSHYAELHARSRLSVAVAVLAAGTARPTPCGCVYPIDMPRCSLRGALHIDLLATVLRGFK